MNRDNLVGRNQKYHQNFLALQKEFPHQGNDLAVVVESEDEEKNRQFVERLGMKMAPETNLFRNIFYQQDLAVAGDQGVVFRPDERSGFHPGKLRDDFPFIQKFTQTTNLVTFFEQINTAFRTAPRETNAQTESLAQSLPVLTRILTQANAAMQMPGQPPSPGVTALFGAGQRDEHLRHAERRADFSAYHTRSGCHGRDTDALDWLEKCHRGKVFSPSCEKRRHDG